MAARALKDLIAHTRLIAGAALMVLPVYMTFVASTNQLAQSLTGLPLLPGDRFIENYRQVLSEGMRNYGLPPIGPMLVNSIIVALAITFGKIAFATVFSLVGEKNFTLG
jgi:sn-glycerol 3-phosphate transport system permease protein